MIVRQLHQILVRIWCEMFVDQPIPDRSAISIVKSQGLCIVHCALCSNLQSLETPCRRSRSSHTENFFFRSTFLDQSSVRNQDFMSKSSTCEEMVESNGR